MEELKALGAKIVIIDYSKPETLVEQLQGIDILISTLAGPGLVNQLPLAQAAKKANVKLFFPR